MERRNLMKTIGGITGIATVGAGALTLTSTEARATASVNYGDVSVTSDDGTVEYVAIFGDSIVTWDGFDEPAEYARIVNEARIPGQVGWTDLNDTGLFELTSSWGGADEDVTLQNGGRQGTIETGVGLDGEDGDHDPTTDWHVVGSDPDGYGLPQNSIDPAALTVDEDGATENFTLELRATYYWYGSFDPNDQLFSESFTSTVDVTVSNEEATIGTQSDDGEDGAVAK